MVVTFLGVPLVSDLAVRVALRLVLLGLLAPVHDGLVEALGLQEVPFRLALELHQAGRAGCLVGRHHGSAGEDHAVVDELGLAIVHQPEAEGDEDEAPHETENGAAAGPGGAPRPDVHASGVAQVDIEGHGRSSPRRCWIRRRPRSRRFPITRPRTTPVVYSLPKGLTPPPVCTIHLDSQQRAAGRVTGGS